MKIDLDRYTIVDEEAAFYALVDKFAVEMKTKFHLKCQQGCVGWMDESNPLLVQSLLNSIERHFKKSGYQMIDIAILASMLWNLGYQSKKTKEL